MNYVRQAWNNAPKWTKVGLATGLAWGLLVNAGNVLVAKHEVDKGYKSVQSDENIRSRFGQIYPSWYDRATYTVGTPGRKIVYMMSE